MSEELGKIEKPSVDSIKPGRKLYFVPLLYSAGEEAPPDYNEMLARFWEQVKLQLLDLQSKLGRISVIYHELLPAGGEEAAQAIKDLNADSHEIIQTCMSEGARLEALEDTNLLTEFMDWSRCMMLGLQNPNVMNKVYEAYTEAAKKRNEHLANKIDETLEKESSGILFMRESHQLQFPADIQLFYISPPALDEIKRWLRARQPAGPEEKEA
jgi:hypothetical protein